MVALTKFDGENYQKWKYEIRAILLSKKLWKITKGDEPDPGAATTDAAKLQVIWREKADMALGLILLSLDDNLHPLVEGKSHPKEVYDAVTARYEPNQSNRLMYLYGQFFGIKLDESQNIHYHFDRINKLRKELTTPNFTFPDSMIAWVTINSLPSSYDVIKPLLRSHDQVDLARMQTTILQHELSLKEAQQGASSSQGLLYTNSTPRMTPPDRHHHQSFNRNRPNYDRQHRDSQSRSGGRGQSQARYCMYCLRQGHTRDQCRTRQREEREKGQG
ncbi:MAG: gag-polypeptide of LTR copia-type domain-containing protein [Sulfobacillus sp.]